MLHIRRCGNCFAYLGIETASCPGCGSSLFDVGVTIEHTNRCPFCKDILHGSYTQCRKCGAHFPIERAHWYGS
ncbi:hypothetical protein HYU06_04935 [Candidatus Woesearchaeota archaeon]|nr:hypothetical protein [Candidatus Woesearchaeota archaeon]